jgi:hypothetical protein
MWWPYGRRRNKKKRGGGHDQELFVWGGGPTLGIQGFLTVERNKPDAKLRPLQMLIHTETVKAKIFFFSFFFFPQ